MLKLLLTWFIPGGSILSLLDSLLKAIVTVIKAVCKSLGEVARSPGTWIAIAVVAGFAFAGGLKVSKERIKALQNDVAVLEQDLHEAQVLNKQWKERLDAQDDRANHAALAREKAESERLIALAKAEAEARAARAALGRERALPRTGGVRNGAGAGAKPAGPKDAGGPGLFQGLPGLFGGGS